MLTQDEEMSFEGDPEEMVAGPPKCLLYFLGLMAGVDTASRSGVTAHAHAHAFARMSLLCSEVATPSSFACPGL